ncbi:MAG: hypothetical protein AAB456_02300 [Patescibacteria group bacterium]
MKTLAIFAVILGILFLYFIVKAEKSLVIKGNEVVPIGIDIPKLIIDKVRGIKSQVTDKNAQVLGSDIVSNLGQGFINNIVTDAKNLVSKTVDKIKESVKSPIENKINEFLCPKK